MQIKWPICRLAFAILILGFFAQPAFGASPDYIHQSITLTWQNGLYISPVIRLDRPFNVMGIKLERVMQGMLVNFNPGNPRGWQPFEVHDDGFDPEALLATEPAYEVRFAKWPHPLDALHPGPIALEADIFYQEEPAFVDTDGLYAGPTVGRGGQLFTREQWGADESLRFWTPELLEKYKGKNGNGGDKDGDTSDPCRDYATRFVDEVGIEKTVDRSSSGDQLIWPLQFSKTIRKIVVHHTDSDIRDLDGDSFINSRDYKQFVRAIYRFHAITRGWGDIGYNYLIDPLGNVYQGRYGGDKVVGGHVLCHNNGALGIAILGNYQENEVPKPALQALTTLVASKAKEFRLDPMNASSFRGKDLPNVVGHKDLRPTACPGNKLYAELSPLRQRASVAYRSGSFGQDFSEQPLDYNADPVTEIPLINLLPAERQKLTLEFRNTGIKTWNSDTWLHVALNNNPNARVMPLLSDKAFVAANLNEFSVAPGEKGTFEIELEGGYKGGNYSFSVAPVVNGRYRVSRAMVDLPFNVESPKYDYEFVKSELPKGTVFQGQRLSGWVELKNTGNVTWRNYGENQMALGTADPQDRKSEFAPENPTRMGYLIQSEVLPGEMGRFDLDLEVPLITQKRAIERFTPVIEKIQWLPDKALGFSVNVKKPRHAAAMKRIDPPSRMLPGEMRRLEIEMRNKGDLTWDEESMGVSLVARGMKVFKNRMVPEKPVKPGEKITLSFWTQAPYQPGQHSLNLASRFNRVPIRGGATRMLIDVQEPRLRAQLIRQGDRQITVRPGEIKELTVQFKNLSNAVWRRDGPNAIYLAPSQPQDRQSALFYEASWVNRFRAAKLKEPEVLPGETGTFTFQVQPNKIGRLQEYFQLVIEQVGWIEGSLVRWDFEVKGARVKSGNQEEAKKAIDRSASVSQSPSNPPAANPSATEPPLTAERPFRVKLSYNSEQATLKSSTPYQVVGNGNEVLFSVRGGEEVSVRRLGDTLHAQLHDSVKTAAILRFAPAQDGIMQITSWEHQPSWNQQLNDNEFRGTIEVRLINDKVTYINELPLEDYIKGLAEVSNDAHLEKQKAIAVLARTYARFYMQPDQRKFPGLPYDGSDDPDIFQRYLGYGFEKRSPQFIGAAALTENEVVTYQGKLVKTPYFNQSDGRTRSAQEIWGWTHTPYLVSVPDPWCEGLEKKGHGVGLSGCGADAQAKKGKTYDEIIKYYYQGVEVEELK